MSGGPACPAPLGPGATVQLAHGGGGRLTADLLEGLFWPAFAADGAPAGSARHDGAVLDLPGGRLAFTTDAYVVQPLFFPGGDIGTLAVFGTVNDLAVCGARPLWLSAAFVLEEGVALDVVERVTRSMAAAARRAGVRIVTGDTKVVDRGRADGLYLATTGVGAVAPGVDVGPARIAPGDAVLVSGDLGRHGIAILSTREGLAFDTPVDSDCAPLTDLVAALLDGGLGLHCARDLTRGGLSSALVELARAARVRIEIDEAAVPVAEPVRGACEVLGLDPLYVACEGRLCAFLPADVADRALARLQAVPGGQGARRIGAVTGPHPDGLVLARSPIGVDRVVDLFSGEQLPRIC